MSGVLEALANIYYTYFDRDPLDGGGADEALRIRLLVDDPGAVRIVEGTPVDQADHFLHLVPGFLHDVLGWIRGGIVFPGPFIKSPPAGAVLIGSSAY
jgi:hypothetical protein